MFTCHWPVFFNVMNDFLHRQGNENKFNKLSPVYLGSFNKTRFQEKSVARLGACDREAIIHQMIKSMRLSLIRWMDLAMDTAIDKVITMHFESL